MTTTQMDAPATVAAIRRMTADGILDHARLAFAHTIVRSSVYDAVPAAIRERLHHLAARVLRLSGADATVIADRLKQAARSKRLIFPPVL